MMIIAVFNNQGITELLFYCKKKKIIMHFHSCKEGMGHTDPYAFLYFTLKKVCDISESLSASLLAIRCCLTGETAKSFVI